MLFFPKQLENPETASHSVTEFLLVDYYDHVDTVYIDVTDSVDIRNIALSKHNSQYSLESVEETTTFFTKLDESKSRYERFRYVKAD